MEYIGTKDTIWRKIFSIIIGIIGGAWAGMIVALIVFSFYFSVIEGISLMGERSFGVVLGALFYGAPVGMVIGAIISYWKRNCGRWRIFFLILSLMWPMQIIAPLVFSPIWFIINIFH